MPIEDVDVLRSGSTWMLTGLRQLVPGMPVTAEIKTGRRRIIGYLLSPLMQHARESMHER